jgi:hypothetical protein
MAFNFYYLIAIHTFPLILLRRINFQPLNSLSPGIHMSLHITT